jgi:aldose 1-epimerase
MDIVSITDRASGSTARIVPMFGFNCFEFLARVEDRTVDVIAAGPEFASTGVRPSGHGTPLLFPFPNRIAGAEFTWDGKTYALPPRPGENNAIHGFAYDRPWRVVERGADHVTGQFQISRDDPERARLWPADGVIEVAYRLRGATLRMDVRVSNPDSRPLPFGFGTHTYFKLPLGSDSDPSRCLIQAPASEMWTLEGPIPTGERRPVSAELDLRRGVRYRGAGLDHLLTGLEVRNGAVECSIWDEAAGVEVVQHFDPVFRELVAFTPVTMAAVCLEPYTCTTDAIHLHERGIDAGWRVLQPGEEWRAWIQITARPVLA